MRLRLGTRLARRQDAGGSVWAYEWDAENRLTRVLQGAVEARFAYDPLGRRVEKVAGGITAAYIYDGVDILREKHTQGSVTGSFTYVHGPGIDEPLGRVDENLAWSYYHADGLGSIVKITDAVGTVVHTYQYDAWGNIEQGAERAGYSFTGREWDPEIELYYYRARYYDPVVGRFLSEDPVGFEAGPNFYGYVDGNPANFVDPAGYSKKKLFLYIMRRLSDGRVFAKKTNIELTVDEAKLLRRKYGRDVAGSKKACKQISGKDAIEEPAHPGGAGERRAHYHDANRGGGHAAFGPDESLLAGIVTALASNAITMAEAGANDPSLTEAEVWKAGAWDVANSIDPLFITDAINWWYGIE